MGRRQAHIKRQQLQQARERALMAFEEQLVQRYKLILRSTCVIQRIWRGHVGRSIALRVRRRWEAARTIQCLYYRSKALAIMSVLRERRCFLNEQALVIQSFWRVSKGRCLVAILRDEAKTRFEIILFDHRLSL